ncbi:hypothetical protein CYJ10_30920 [Cupriavidus pauculus]|uniref:Nucleoside 2-deoxyribosyltransferase n=2 Tax=Cupriavidus pauculus TaxID=82633 RepID=A0A2N5C3J9_9BURK|nr:hypothetical protein CYJ10_30920 [Cupriavidus pauculus]
MSQNEDLFAFVVMPFDKKFKDLYLYGIKDTAAKLGVRAERLDEQIYQEGMLERIYRQIDLADIVIADMSDKNPNVFYEVGYAHAKGKLCILLTSDAADIPFDLKHRRHIVHGASASTLAASLEAELKWAQEEIRTLRRSRIKVEFREPSGLVRRDKWEATAEVDFVIDLKNDSNLPSPEIEAAYLLTSDRWSISQNGKTCPRAGTAQDGTIQHFLDVPIRRLRKDVWGRLEFKGTRLMASIFNGEELKSEYQLSGTLALKLVTSEGVFDYNEYLDISIDEIPF